MLPKNKIASSVIIKKLPFRILQKLTIFPFSVTPASKAQYTPIGDYPNKTAGRTPMPERSKEKTDANHPKYYMESNNLRLSCERYSFGI